MNQPPVATVNGMRRCTALLVLALLAAALPSVGLAATPAGAANTADEFLVDPSDRYSGASDPASGVREFGGADRYATSLRLAERYAHERGGLGATSTAVFVAGDSVVDGVTAAGLAASYSAPILLSTGDRLSRAQQRFLERHLVSEVIVVGGPSAISDRFISEVAALDWKPKTRRIAGADRAETAALAAAEIGSPSSWCIGNKPAALLANQRDDHQGLLAAVALLASLRELPVLLTDTGQLPAASAAFMDAEDIEHVIVIGDRSVVGEDVLTQLSSLGIDDIERIATRDAASTAAAMANLMQTECGSGQESSEMVAALASGRTLIDAIPAAPLLAHGLGDSGPVPLLFVDTPLHEATARFLSATPQDVDGVKTHMSVVALGGRQSISDAVMAVALDAARTSGPIRAQIAAATGEDIMTVSFSEQLRVNGERFNQRIRDVLYVNGAPAHLLRIQSQDVTGTDPCAALTSLTITLGHELSPGDVIELESFDGWFSVNGDRRPVEGASHIVTEARIASSILRTRIVALSGQNRLNIVLSGDGVIDSEGALLEGIRIDTNRIRVGSERAGTIVASSVGPPVIDRFFRTATYQFAMTSAGSEYRLAVGDVVRMRGSAFRTTDRRSRSHTATVKTPTLPLTVSSVRAGPANPGVDDSPTTRTPDMIEGVSTRATATLGESLLIVGRWSGAAAGAAGNDWTIDVDRGGRRLLESASAISRTDEEGVRVWLDTRSSSMVIRLIDPLPGTERDLTYGRLAAALNSNQLFRRHFAAELVDGCGDDSQKVDLDEDEGLKGSSEFSGGLTSVSFLTTFNDYVLQFNADDQSDIATATDTGEVLELVDDILSGQVAGYATTPFGTAAGERVIVSTQLPNSQVLFRFTTSDPERIPAITTTSRRPLVTIGAGIARGPAADDSDTELNESVNVEQKLFVGRGSDALLRNPLGVD